MTGTTERAFFRDLYFGAALVAALPFWALLWWLNRSSEMPAPLPSQLSAALMIVVVYPVVEELVFRGALQGFLLQKIQRRLPGPMTAANIITSIVFAALHAIVWATPWSLLVVIPSLVYGYFRDRTDGVTASIVLHMYYNAGFFLVTLAPGSA